MLLGLALGPPIIGGFTWILQRTSAYMPLYLWAFFFGLQIFFMTIYPVFIAPLFNKFSPLEKGPLRCAAVAVTNQETCCSVNIGIDLSSTATRQVHLCHPTCRFVFVTR